MIDVALAFIAGLLVSPYVIGALVIWGLIADYKDARGWTTFWGFLLGISAYLLFKPTWPQFGITVASYIPAGIVWSIVKFKIQVLKAVNEFNREFDSMDERNQRYAKTKVDDKISFKANSSKIVYWAWNWPINFICTIFSDVFTIVAEFIKEKCKGIYLSIENSGRSRMKKLPVER